MAYSLEMNKENLKGTCVLTEKEIEIFEQENGYLPPCGAVACSDCFTDDCKHVCDYYKVVKDEE